MLSDKQINEISAHANWEVRFLHSSLSVVIRDAIEKALAMAEKSRWKYPDKGELPEDKEIVLCCFGERKNCDMAIHDKQGKVFIEVVDHLHFPYGEVKAWTYAPVLEEE